MKALMVYCVLLCPFLGAVPAMADDAIPFKFNPITSADAARLVRVSMDGDVAAVIGVGIQDTPGNVSTFTRAPGTTNWTMREMLPAPGFAYDVDVDSCGMAIGLQAAVSVWSITCNASKPIWFKDATISFTNNSYVAQKVDLDGDRLAVLVTSGEIFFGGGNSIVQIYDRLSASNWVLRAEVSNVHTGGIFVSGSQIDEFDLDGDRIAIAYAPGQEMYIHEKDVGGVNNWGMAANVPLDPVGTKSRGYSLALAGTRLAASSFNEITFRPQVLVYSNNIGGAGNWGYAGTLLNQPVDTGIAQLDTDNGRLAVLGGPSVGNFLDTGKHGHFWVYDSGAGPGGWLLQKNGTTAAFNWSLFESSFLNRFPSISISSNDFIMGVGDTNTYQDIAGWSASIHNKNKGGANQWGRERLFEAAGNPGDFGKFVHMDGQFLVAGMPGDDWDGADSGSAYVWFHNDVGGQSTWFPVARLAKNDGEPGDRFGEGVAIYQTDDYEARVVVGAPGEFTDNGAVYVFEVSVFQGQLAPAKRIIPFPYNANSQFGYSVGINFETIAVGAPLSDIVSADAGAVYIFEKDFGGVDAWGARTTNLPPVSTFSFGSYMDMISSKLAVTMYTGADGSVAVYGKDTGGADQWGLFDTILPPPNTAGGFPAAVDFLSNGSGLLIGDTGGAGTNIGKAHLFLSTTGSPYEVFYTIEGSVADGTSFGFAVAWLNYSGMAIGAPFAGPGGRTRLYTIGVSGGVTNVNLMATGDGEPGDNLGYTLTGGSFYLVACAPGNDDNGSNAGRVETMRIGSYEIWAGSQPSAFTNAWFPWENWDGDLDANLMEFAMGTDPMSDASNQKLIMYVHQGTTTNMAWTEPSPAYSTFGLHYNMQSSDDLENWGSVSYISHPTNFNIRLYDANEVKQHYRLAPLYPVYTPEGGSGGIIVEIIE